MQLARDPCRVSAKGSSQTLLLPRAPLTLPSPASFCHACGRATAPCLAVLRHCLSVTIDKCQPSLVSPGVCLPVCLPPSRPLRPFRSASFCMLTRFLRLLNNSTQHPLAEQQRGRRGRQEAAARRHSHLKIGSKFMHSLRLAATIRGKQLRRSWTGLRPQWQLEPEAEAEPKLSCN